jgi:hypothetical protein
VLLEGGRRIRGRTLPPELVDEAVAGNGLAGVEKEDREDTSLPRAAERQLPLVVVDLERAEDAEVERGRQRANVPRRRCQPTDSVLRAPRERLCGRSLRPTTERRNAMRLAVLTLAIASLAAGCGGGSDSASLAEGVYESELTEQYLLDNGIPAQQAADESGVHTITLQNGSFTDKWRASNGTDGFCTGTYKEDGTRVTFTWISGCFGDWAMTYSVDGDVVTWSDHEASSSASEEEQKVIEVFNGVPWTRVGDAS